MSVVQSFQLKSRLCKDDATAIDYELLYGLVQMFSTIFCAIGF